MRLVGRRFLVAPPARVTLPLLAALAWAVLVIGPVAALVVETVTRLLVGHSEWLALAIPAGDRGPLLARSVGLSAGVALMALLLGVLAASALSSARLPWVRRWRWAGLAFAPIPPYIHALAWGYNGGWSWPSPRPITCTHSAGTTSNTHHRRWIRFGVGHVDGVASIGDRSRAPSDRERARRCDRSGTDRSE